MLGDRLLPLEGGKLAQLHLEDGARLHLVDVEQLDQSVTRLDRAAAPDEGDDLVEHVERLEQAAQDVDVLLGLVEAVCRAALDDLDLVLHPVPDEGVDRQGARHAVDQGEHVGAEIGLGWVCL